MEVIARELETLINKHISALREIPADLLQQKPIPTKWSRQEIVGHLIDSAQNNIRRFIVAQYEAAPLIVYQQDEWVRCNNYQQYPSSLVVELWYLQNQQLINILGNINSTAAKRVCRTEGIHTLESLATDYIFHLKHHLHQVLDLEPIPYP